MSGTPHERQTLAQTRCQTCWLLGGLHPVCDLWVVLLRRSVWLVIRLSVRLLAGLWVWLLAGRSPAARWLDRCQRRFWICLLGLLLGLLLSGRSPALSQPASRLPPDPPIASVSSLNPLDLLEQGRSFYAAGQFAAAVTVWQQAAQQYQTQGDFQQQAIALTYLSLAQQELGNWSEAEAAISRSVQLLQADPAGQSLPLAQALNARGRLEFLLGQATVAIATWQQATDLYRQQGDRLGVTGGLINQAQALEAAGAYRRACATLLQAMGVEQRCEIAAAEAIDPLLAIFTERSPDPMMTALGLRSLGNLLRLMGYLPQSQQALEQSLRWSAALPAPTAQTALLSLAHTERDLYQQAQSLYDRTSLPQDRDRALAAAQQAQQRYESVIAQTADRPTDRLIHLQAQLQRLSLLIDLRQWLDRTHPTAAQQPIPAQIQAQIQDQIQALLAADLAQLPPSRTAIYAQLHFAESLVEADRSQLDAAIQLAQIARQQSDRLQDELAQSYALGTLGGFYEQIGQVSFPSDVPPVDALEQARQFTASALGLAQANQAWEIAYRWQWQLGRIYRMQGERELAIRHYQAAVESLEAVRQNLVAIESERQFSFRDTVEPVYRELVALLLQTGTNLQNPAQTTLQQVVQSIDALQLTELENFLRCNLAPAVAIDQAAIDPTAAVIHTIILDQQLAVIARLPGSTQLHLHTLPLTRSEVESILNNLRGQLTRPFLAPSALREAQQVYDWLIRPIEPLLSESGVKTLVFVLDGPLRNLPMAALYDGEHYLIERYAIALTPGLQLLEPTPLPRIPLQVLTFGLSEMRPDFPPHAGFVPLANVEQELSEIQAQVPSQILLNQAFTGSALQNSLRTSAFPIVHLATHGQFSSNPADTFILAWDERIDLNTLSRLLQSRETDNPHPIELLVLSACKTADGDRWASLGLAGIAVQSGARSTIASLWSVDDAATAELMGLFYRELAAEGSISRSEALRRAQVQLLNRSGYQAPRFWAPYILVGNWL